MQVFVKKTLNKRDLCHIKIYMKRRDFLKLAGVTLLFPNHVFGNVSRRGSFVKISKQLTSKEIEKQQIQKIIGDIYGKYGITVRIGSGNLDGVFDDIRSKIFASATDDRCILAGITQLQEDLSAFNPEFLKDKARLKNIYLTSDIQHFMIDNNGRPTFFKNITGEVSVLQPIDRKQVADSIALGLDSSGAYQTSILEHEIGHLVYHNNYDQFPHAAFRAFKQVGYLAGNDNNYGYTIHQKQRVVSDPEISPELSSQIIKAMGYKRAYGRTNEDEDFATMSEDIRYYRLVYSATASNADKARNIVYHFYKKLGAFKKMSAPKPPTWKIPTPSIVRFRK